MLDWILNLIPGGGLTAVLGAIVAALGMIVTMFYGIKKAGRDEQKAKELDAYEKHLKDIARAGDAKPSGGVQSDPYNRDRRK